MNPFLVWLLKSSVSLALLYAVFKLAVSRDKMHTANRFVLLGILLTSVVLPFADVPVIRETQVIPQFEAIHEWVAAPAASEPVIYTEDMSDTISKATSAKAPLNPWLVFYLAVIGLLMARLLFSVVRVGSIIRQAEKQHFRDVVLAIVKDFIQPFSFLQHIVLSEKDFTENRDIVVAHEYAHIQHKHALDLMICELFTALFWFNPVVWLLRRDLKLIHEYQADQAVLNQGIDAKTYQLLVLKKAVGERRFALANHFSQKPILKRIKMMHMKTNRRHTSLKLVLFVPVIALLLQAFARPEIIVEKAGAYLPAIGQQDSSEVWVENWVSARIKYLTNEDYFNDDQLLTIIDSNRPIAEENTVHKNNVFIILQNLKGELLVENQRLELKDLRTYLDSFLKGKNEISGENPDVSLEELPFVGKVTISQGTILYRKDVATPQDATEAVMKKIAEAILSVRQEMAKAKFGNDYFSLSIDKKVVVNKMIPGTTSFQIPKGIKRSSVAPPPPPLVNIRIAKDGGIYVERYYVQPKPKDEKWQLIDNKELTIEQLKRYLMQRKQLNDEANRKNGTNHEQGVNVTVENGASEKVVSEVKETLFFAGIKNANFKRPADNTPSSQNIGKYDVRVYSDRLEVFNNVSTVENVKQEVEESLKSMGDKTTISVLSFSDVPKKRLDAVLNELNQVPFVKVSTTVLKLEQEPVSTAQHKIMLKANGRINLDDKEYNLTGFEAKIREASAGKQPLKIALEVENNTTNMQLETVKRILRDAKVDQVGYSIQKHFVRETEPGTKVGEPTYGFSISWRGAPDMEKTKRAAEDFLSGTGNRSLYTSIFPEKNATQEEIDAVKKVLLNAGFLKVDVRKN
ncbi:M56 family metallopeptidase [Maribellus sp. YY47]|uniref:M56 family metallopeptidase n=1 Tax=Maribellus sp. YY47 TaxID=2929486 RepID=UPI00200107C9|nr:M56 family metallopeptidase [Maribellus sp. YY47]MCK3686309.1 M56 family metallopeptidase [Maribellus sp. YY47]